MHVVQPPVVSIGWNEVTTTEKILSFIQTYEAEHGKRPAYRVIGKALGISSHQTIAYHLIKSGAIAEYNSNYCDCGKLATVKLDIRVGMLGKTKEKLPLCDDCAKLEARLSKVSSYRL